MQFNTGNPVFFFNDNTDHVDLFWDMCYFIVEHSTIILCCCNKVKIWKRWIKNVKKCSIVNIIQYEETKSVSSVINCIPKKVNKWWRIIKNNFIGMLNNRIGHKYLKCSDKSHFIIWKMAIRSQKIVEIVQSLSQFPHGNSRSQFCCQRDAKLEKLEEKEKVPDLNLNTHNPLWYFVLLLTLTKLPLKWGSKPHALLHYSWNYTNKSFEDLLPDTTITNDLVVKL